MLQQLREIPYRILADFTDDEQVQYFLKTLLSQLLNWV